MDGFKDMLEAKRDGYNLWYVMKRYAPKKMQMEKETFNPELFKQYAMDSLANSAILNELSEELHISKKDLLDRIDKVYDEIGRGRNVTAMRIFAFCFLKVLKNTIAQLFVTETKILTLKRQVCDKSIVLLPTHRSYADCSLITWILYDYNIEVPSVVSGIGLGEMCIISYLLRSSGAMFMRRTFQNDKVYSIAFKTYVQTLLKKADAPFDFFIEGTRSRSGKSLMPKFGCLKIIIDLFNNDHNSDIVLLPISVHYDKVLEDELYAYEVLGQSKPKESTVKLMKGIVNVVTRNNGNAYVNFCEPISLSEHFNQHKGFDLDILAHTVIISQKKNTIFTSFNLLCAVLVSHMYSNNNYQFPLQRVIADMKRLKHLLKSFGAIVNFEDGNQDALKEIKRMVLIHENLVTLDEQSNMIYVNTAENKIPSTSNADTDHRQSDLILLIMLQYYANSCVHFIVNMLIIVTSLSTTSNPINKDKLFSSYSYLRRIFKNEFVLHSHFENEEFQETLQILNKLDTVREKNSLDIYLNCENNFRTFLCGLMKPFVQSFLFICEYFLQNINKKFDRNALILAIRKHVSCEVQRSEYKYSYALSSDFISNSLASLCDMDIINFDKQNKDETYECKNSDGITEVTIFLRALRLDD